MSAPSGFLDCFLKFLKGDEGEKLPPPMRGGGRPRVPSIYGINKPKRSSCTNVNNSQVVRRKQSTSKSKKKGGERSEEKGKRSEEKEKEERSEEKDEEEKSEEKDEEERSEEKEEEERGEEKGGGRRNRKGKMVTDDQTPIKRKRGRPPKKTHCVKHNVKTEEIHEKSDKHKRLRLEDDLKDEDSCMSSRNESNSAGGVVGDKTSEKTVNESEALEVMAGRELLEVEKKTNILTVKSEVKKKCLSETEDESEAMFESEATAEIEGRAETKGMAESEGMAKSEGKEETEGMAESEGRAETEGMAESEGRAETEGMTESEDAVESEAKAESEEMVESVDKAESEQNSVVSNGGAINCTKKDDEEVPCNLRTVHRKKNKEKKKVKSKGEAPRRRLSARKAKQKPNISYAESGSEEDLPGLKENSDSDNDPIWEPNKKNSSDEDSGFSWSKYEKLHVKPKWMSSNCHLPVSSTQPKEDKRGHRIEIKTEIKEEDLKGKSVSDSGGSLKANPSERKGPLASKHYSMVSSPMGSDISKPMLSITNGMASSIPIAVVSPEERSSLLNPVTILMPFQSGSFIAQQKDLEELQEPVIWRVDGKSLLQKYEPFRGENGSIMYRNVSTYSGWAPKSQFEYQQVPVKFIQQSRNETIVQIIQEELVINEEKLIEKLIKDYEKHSYSYEVYLQTLISQALDTNFIPEIIAEKDDYFLNSVNELDQVCEEKKTKLLKSCQWTRKLKESLVTWPTMVVSSEDTLTKERCEVCCYVNDAFHIKMDGEPYKSSTLDYSPPSDVSFKCKDFYVCKKCSECVMLYHKIAHLKYHTYTDGSRMVSEKQVLDPSKDNTSILHDILADGPNIQKKFHEISLMWAQADIKSRRTNEDKKKHSLN